MAVALVLVSHSALLAQGAVELAGQMAPDVPLLPAAGTREGGLGTSLDVVTGAVERALVEADGVVVLADLGSAVLTVESALDLEDEWSGRVVLADAPFVEGAVAAAVTAQQGGSLGAVLAAAEEAGGTFRASASASVPEAAPAAVAGPSPDDDGVVTARVVVRNALGLHARPAAQLARAVADLGVPVSVGGVDGSSVLQLLALGATGGKELEVSARGAGAQEAVRAVVGLVEGGFGEA
ncbi:dihydroxyacetone kinase, phosphotransfer subunit [Xylanimonas cellulosilytica DSM 15894]|uniref:Phosphocarrier protein HPr n=1 Tax=Xylanimonas cellulosilytica (strain DSM 15894 / JCM 12276 / CECT 5975 / KCTC 9989 / LMG 20990 / NBRC 107835 / XIL07) TaxID=446471 RepID=D1BZN3_XYLCX|nr:dihydroxyacetone kinase phosphoryl donor subunit DhaM [Xylanimonas cellulosilytica]ACZ30187.1 dihydroxyacetone kinase, phosphotransfer subunit [Xylanimonas cellulosilytica DSM 15894]